MKTAGIRRILSLPRILPRSQTLSPPDSRTTRDTETALSTQKAHKGVVLYCQAQGGFAERYMGAQTAHDILTNGFQDRHYRFHARLNGWKAPTEWIEGDGVHLADRPTDPSGVTGVQLEVILALKESALIRYEMIRSEATAIDYTGEAYRKDREFLIPASLLNRKGDHPGHAPDDEAYAKCSFRIAEVEERAQRLRSLPPASRQAAA